MTIETSFDVGDVVWFAHPVTFLAATSNVLNVRTVTTIDGTTIKYELTNDYILDEVNLFSSQENLANSFAP